MSPRPVAASFLAVLAVLAAALSVRGPFARAQDGDAAPPKKPPFSERTLLVFGFKGADAKVVAEIAKALQKELGIKTEVLRDKPAPTEKESRDDPFIRGVFDGMAGRLGLKIAPDARSAAVEKAVRAALAKRNEPQAKELLAKLPSSRVQWRAESLIEQAKGVAGDRFDDPGVHGVLAVTDEDLYMEDLAFCFGGSVGRAGVISYARFADKSKKLTTRRTSMQAFSTGGFILGLPRCSSKSCARAYPESLEEHDRKDGTICGECRANLDERRDAK